VTSGSVSGGRRRGALAVVALAAVATLSGCAAAAAHPAPTGIGAWPTFLPSPPPASTAHGDAASPALSYAGSPVDVTTADGRVHVDVQGPQADPGTPLDAETVGATFTVTLSGAKSTIPLAPASFDVLDHLGSTHQVVALDPLPDSIAPGTTTTVRLRSLLPAGEGLLRFAPAGDDLAAWDFVLETD
jgi:hypothetical protein